VTTSASDLPPRLSARREFALRVLPALCWAALIFIGGGAAGPQPELDVGLPIDKLEHVVAFLIMQVLADRAFRYALPRQSRSRQAWLAALAAAGVGVLLELYQLGLPHRSAEFADVVADCVGAGIGALLLGRSS
jgi:VanZ family protein